MEERYEIREKLGEGGIGSVHRVYDRKLCREVAIKRILSDTGNAARTSEATRQLLAESQALAALQHPHIVTILDVGQDEEGPYVVMEFLNGKSLDEVLDQAPLTWEDFCEVAKQSLEALMAAHNLQMLHSDLKTANLMLTWLPSGKFQVKVLDFGLTRWIQSQSQEEISKMESVYGSINFMPPEQFERQVLDERSDLYSLGCCFYQALAGSYPFNGSTAQEVMHAHLNHVVKPLDQIRPNIPLWACQWVMQLIRRDRNERPSSARDALASFIQHERIEDPEMSIGHSQTRRPKLVIATVNMAPPPELAINPAAACTSDDTVACTPESSPHSVAKTLLKVVAAILGLLLIAGIGWLIQLRNERVIANDAYYQLISHAAKAGHEDVMVNGEQLYMALSVIEKLDPKTNLALACHALVIAKASDDTPIDSVIATFATQPGLRNDLRIMLFDQVLVQRRHPDAATILIAFAAKTHDQTMALAAMEAADAMTDDRHAPALLDILNSSTDQEMLETVEQMLRDLIFYSGDRLSLLELLAHEDSGSHAPAKEAIDRLLEEFSTSTNDPEPPRRKASRQKKRSEQ